MTTCSKSSAPEEVGVVRSHLMGFGLAVITLAGCASANLGPFSLEWGSQGPYSFGDLELRFDLLGSSGGRERSLRSSDLILQYEQKLHAYVFDQSLSEFRHVHPAELEDGTGWALTLSLGRNGSYHMWIEGMVNGPSQAEELLVSSRFEVTGGEEAWPVADTLEISLTGSDGDSSAELEFAEPPRKSYPVQMRLSFSRLDGSSPEIGEYLGASVHLTGAHLGTGDLSHAHGIRVEEGGEVRMLLEATFPRSGYYRLWAQYKDGERVVTIPFAVQVD